jgi:hypothetical protein
MYELSHAIFTYRMYLKYFNRCQKRVRPVKINKKNYVRKRVVFEFI